MKTESKESLVSNSGPEDEENAGQKNFHINAPDEYILTETEKKFLLAAERGDCATVKWIIEENAETPKEFSIDCVDPLNRSALISAIENENFDLITLLLEEGIQVKDALLHAISEEYIEAVEELLIWEEKTHVQGKPYSWEAVDRSKSNFTPDITPLILAAHRNNYEILKVLLDRGASLPMPHDVKCGCDECVVSQETDSLRHSQSRINAYRALSSSSLIALSSIDPVLTAFELSWELKRLQRMESEFRAEYTEMRLNVQEFSTSLLDYARTSSELEVMLNYNHEVTPDVWMPGDRQTLERLKLAIKYKQKNFIAHPNVQQLLGAIWYDGLPGFRRKTMPQQLIDVAKLACMFPVYSMNYIMAPYSDMGKFMRKPFVKFISHSASYAFFLMLLGAASQRVEYLALELIGLPWMLEILKDWKERERGSFPGPIECAIMMYITSLIFAEIKTLYSCGLWDYISDLWNIVDFISNCFYVTWIFCRATAWIIVHRDAWYRDINPYFPREHWHLFDPMLLSEGAFAAGMIFSFLKLVHIFSINPHLGPLQVSLGRMIIDIIKFFFIYTLVLFAFGCGLNQLLWYYADLEKRKCFHFHPDVADFDDNEKECTIWRRFANLFETSQSLFWASFGLVDLVSFDLAGIKGFTRFWALLMFGSYSVINIIVLLNMLIAMMSNSYQIISERADVEWKFARSQLWMSYFEEGDTLPPPFNLCPTVKMLGKTLGKGKKRTRSLIRRSMEKARTLHEKVMKLLVRRYITAEQRKRDDFGITEDDIIEVRQDISSLRYELLDIFNQNNMRVPDIEKKTGGAGTKKGKVMERRIMKDFQIGIVETIKNEIKTGATDVFKSIANVVGKKGEDGDKKDWNAIVRKNTLHRDPIGSTKSSMIRRSQRSLRRKMIEDANAGLRIDTDKLVEFNPKLSDVPQGTRVAYVKFMSKAVSKREQLEHISEKAGVESTSAGANKDQAGTSKSSIKKGNESQKTQAPGVPIAAVIKSKPGDKGADQSKTSIKKPEAPGAKPAAAGAAAEANKKAPTGAPPSTDAKAKAPAKPDSAPPSKPADSKPEAGAAKSEPANKPDAAPAGTKPDSAPPASKPDSAPPASKPGSAPPASKPDSAPPDNKPDAAPPASKPAAKGPESKPATDSGAEGGAAGGSTDQKAGAGGKTGEAKDDKKSDSKPADADKKPAEGAAAKPGDKPAGAAGDKKPDPKDKKPPPKSKPGQSSAAAGGDRGKSTVTGRMISGWL